MNSIDKLIQSTKDYVETIPLEDRQRFISLYIRPDRALYRDKLGIELHIPTLKQILEGLQFEEYLFSNKD